MILELLKTNGGILSSYNDYFYRSDYLDTVQDDQINDNDMTLMLSLDGAQLYHYKQSDCWIYIWIIMDLPPNIRYHKKSVLIGGIIPGPNKPKIIDSYLFPGLHHFKRKVFLSGTHSIVYQTYHACSLWLRWLTVLV
jgi:hypothetical protein